MKPREFTEKLEAENLSEYAVLSANAKRKRIENKCDYRTEFQRDRDRITHSKAFRRLSHKTQVFIAPEGDHYRTRLSHTLEVTQISRTIARALRLNEDLTEAIALGHDLGHTPFGHTGEDALDSISPTGFRHNEQSVRILERLENNHRGYNLTVEVIDGIFHHRTSGRPNSLEGRVVQLADKIAYVNHDIDDAIRAGLLKNEELPKACIELLGNTSSSRINFLVSNIINTSLGKDFISLEPAFEPVFDSMRNFMFETVYHNQLVQSEREIIHHMIEVIHAYYCSNLNSLPPEFIREIEDGENPVDVVCDHIACMTDRFALRVFTEITKTGSYADSNKLQDLINESGKSHTSSRMVFIGSP